MQADLTTAEVLGTGHLVYGAGLRDAVVAEISGQTYIYLVTGSGGGLTALELGPDGSLAVVDEMPLGGDFATGAEPRLIVTEIDGSPTLVLSGQTAAASRSVTLLPDGGFGASGALSGDPAALDQPVVAEGPDGSYLVAGAADGNGLQSWSLAGGALTPAGSLPDSADRDLAGVSDTALLVIDGASYIVAVSATENALTVMELGAGGALSVTGDIGAADGLGIDTPQSVETATTAGRNFAVVAGAGSGSLSVFEIGAGGVPVTADHLIDDLATRFEAVEALAVHSVGDRVFVAAGGADDGVSLFMLAPNGRLIHVDTVADSVPTTLTNVSTLALFDDGAHLQIVAAGEGEAGVTRLELSLGGLGQTLTADAAGGALSGGALDDILVGGGAADALDGAAGNDVLIDGGWSDTMTGGAGADLFVFEADGQLDTVTDFEPGVDRLDLSSFERLYDPAQLTAVPQGWGVRLIWHDETIDLYSADGGPIDVSGWTAADILDGDRPGDHPIAQTLEGSAAGDNLRGGEGEDTIRGFAGVDTLDGEGGADRIEAGTGNDFVTGGTGDDLLFGEAGFDEIWGGAGNDEIHGGNEADTLYGDAGEDLIWGDGGVDNIFAGADDDIARGGSLNDRIWGGAGNDILYGDTQEDRLFGEEGDDTLYGGAGFDRLEGGVGRDTLWGGNQADNLYGQAGDDVMWGEGGFDRLFGGDGDDWGDGGEGPDSLFGDAGNDTLFGGADDDRFFGGSGNDEIFGGEGSDTVWAGAGFDVIDGGPGNDILEGNFNADLFVFRDGHGSDIVTDFAAQNDFERIDLAAVTAIADFDDLVGNHLTQSGGDVLIDTGNGDSITLVGVSLTDLDVFDFVF
ncbi:MAG: calcium-binding protein [Paracoccaceae bacterium]|nr:calcium-binding protein [Paracoccaceae bacterium]